MPLSTHETYVQQGLPILALHAVVGGQCTCGAKNCVSAGKHPAGGGVHSASLDAAVARALAARGDRNVGIALPDGIIAVDIDPRHAGDVTVMSLPDLPDTRTAETGGGGWHLLYRVPPGTQMPAQIGAGIDIKQAGGYIVAEPSTHASGGTYRWVDPEHPIADAPQWLLDLGWRRGDRSRIDIVVDDECRLSEDDHARIVDALTPVYTHGHRHELAWAIGNWLMQRGATTGDITEVVSQLPSADPAKRICDAIDGATYECGGWHQIVAALGETDADALDASVGNPEKEAADAVFARTQIGRADAPLTDDDWGDLTGSQVLAAGEAPIDWLCEDLGISSGAPTILAGYGGSQKTWAVLDLALAVLTGTPVWGLLPVARRGRVRILDYEMGAHSLGRRLRRMAVGRGVSATDLDSLVVSPLPRFCAESRGAEEALRARCEGFELCVIDSFHGFTPSADENDATVRNALDMLTRVSDATGCKFVVVHHANKSGRTGRTALRGSAALYDACGSVVLLEREDEDKADSAIRFAVDKNRHGTSHPQGTLGVVDTDARGCVLAVGVQLVAPGVLVTAKRDGGVVAKEKPRRDNPEDPELRAAIITSMRRLDPEGFGASHTALLGYVHGWPQRIVRAAIDRWTAPEECGPATAGDDRALVACRTKRGTLGVKLRLSA